MTEPNDPGPVGLLPVRDSPETKGFWDAVTRRELAVLRCVECGRVIHLPLPRCPRCGSWDVAWQPMSGHAVVHSWTVAEHQVHPAYPVPYTIVLVELEEAPEARFLTALPGDAEVACGQRMQLGFTELDDGGLLPHWVPASRE